MTARVYILYYIVYARDAARRRRLAEEIETLGEKILRCVFIVHAHLFTKRNESVFFRSRQIWSVVFCLFLRELMVFVFLSSFCVYLSRGRVALFQDFRRDGAMSKTQ